MYYSNAITCITKQLDTVLRKNRKKSFFSLTIDRHVPLSERSCREQFQNFKNGEFDIEDKERSGRPEVYEDAELEALLEENSLQTQEELAHRM